MAFLQKKSKETRQWRQNDLNRPSRWQGNQNRLTAQLGRISAARPRHMGQGTRTRRPTLAGLPRAESGNLRDVHGGQAAPKMLAALSSGSTSNYGAPVPLIWARTGTMCSKPPSSCVVGRLSLPIAHGRCQIFVTSRSAFSRTPSSSWCTWMGRAETQVKLERLKMHFVGVRHLHSAASADPKMGTARRIVIDRPSELLVIEL